MTALATYLWKEWRDHRMTLLGILGVQFVACVLLVLFAGHTDFVIAGLVSAITLGTLALTLVVFGPELIGGEARSGTLGFLDRMPSGLSLAFWAKVLFLLAALGALCGSGYLISAGFHLMVAGYWVSLVPSLLVDGMFPGAVTLGLLLMAVSCWLPRSILTVPTTALLAAALFLPCYLIWNRNIHLASYLPMERWIHVGPLLALGILWLSFARGRRAGGGPAASAWRGLLACVLATIPLWSWVGYWMHDWSTPRPHESLLIKDGYMGAGGKLAFLNLTQRNWPMIGLVVDLETGDWHRLGELEDCFARIGRNDWFGFGGAGEHLLLDLFSMDERRYQTVPYVDTATGEVIHEANVGTPYAGILDEARTTRANLSPIRMPDGRRVWWLRRKLEMDSEGGGFEELPWDRRDVIRSVIGYGLAIYAIHNHRESVIYDLTRRRRFDDRGFDPGTCWVLESRWLVSDRGPNPLGASHGLYFQNWRLLDPETGAEEPAPGLRDGDRVVAILDDGRILASHEGDTVDMFTVDLPSGTRRPLAVEGISHSRWRLGEWSPLRTADGRRLFRMHMADHPYYLTSLAPGSDTLTPPVPMWSILGTPDPSTALILTADRKALERVDLVTGKRERVFPRPR